MTLRKKIFPANQPLLSPTQRETMTDEPHQVHKVHKVDVRHGRLHLSQARPGPKRQMVLVRMINPPSHLGKTIPTTGKWPWLVHQKLNYLCNLVLGWPPSSHNNRRQSLFSYSGIVTDWRGARGYLRQGGVLMADDVSYHREVVCFNQHTTSIQVR